MLQESLEIVSERNACQLYDRFVAGLIRLHQQQINPDLSQLLVRYLNMSNRSQFQQIDKLKSWLDSFRPLSPIIVAELKKLSDVQFTYNSNAIEGNTLTQSETLRLVSTATDSRGKGMPFYEDMITLLNS